jgi:hypothetical protein
MNQSSAAQRPLPFVGRAAVTDPRRPWLDHPQIREAFDEADRLQQCLDGFAALMSRDSDVIQGKCREDIDALVLYLNEKHREAVEKARDATWSALSADH